MLSYYLKSRLQLFLTPKLNNWIVSYISGLNYYFYVDFCILEVTVEWFGENDKVVLIVVKQLERT